MKVNKDIAELYYQLLDRYIKFKESKSDNTFTIDYLIDDLKKAHDNLFLED